MEAIDLGNWFRLSSSKFGRSDLAAEYYDRIYSRENLR
jgi:hypothetical protein